MTISPQGSVSGSLLQLFALSWPAPGPWSSQLLARQNCAREPENEAKWQTGWIQMELAGYPTAAALR